MHPRTEEFLAMLLWTGEALARPTWRNLTESFEAWAYRTGMREQLLRLERQQLLVRQSEAGADRLHRLTEAGRLHVLGGRDPVACWSRAWDRRWRVVLFDVPEAKAAVRDRLRRMLAGRGFGYLQNSVWITPDPVPELRSLLAGGPVNVESFLVLEARPGAGETDADIVAGAWDFSEINRRYQAYEAVLARRPEGPLESDSEARRFQRWLAEERAAWQDSSRSDPLLPECLWPAGYRGREAWRKRLGVMSEAGRQMRAFRRA